MLFTQQVYDRLNQCTDGKFEFWQTASGSPGPAATTMVALPQLKKLSGRHLFSCYVVPGMTEQKAFDLGIIVKIKNNKVVCSPPYTWSKIEYTMLNKIIGKEINYA